MAGMNDVGSAAGFAKPGPSQREFLLVLTDGGGTIPPELGVARRLVGRGHRVTVLAAESMAGQVRASGAKYLPCKGAPVGELRDWGRQGPARLARAMVDHMFVGPAPGQAESTMEVLRQSQTSLVLASFPAFGAMIAAEAHGTDFAVLMPNAYPLPARGLPQPVTGMSPARGPLGRLRDSVVAAGSSRLMDRYALARVNALRADHGLAPIATTWDQVHHARRQLILTSAAFDFPGELPANARYVGPILDDPAWATDTQWTPPVGEVPLVLVSMSSTFQDHVACLQRIADALGMLPVRGLLTTGPAIQPGQIRAPANVTVVASAPHSRVLPDASLMITHGGHGTVIKALAAGIPLVILHHGRDQAGNAVRVTARGAGVSVPRSAQAPRIAKAVAHVLATPGYGQAAQTLGRSIAGDAKENALLAELEG